MAIPKYHEMYRPFLDCLADGLEHNYAEVKEYIYKATKTTDEERNELLPSGKQTIISSRSGWARTYLKNAGLISSPRRGVLILTDEGRKLLIENPPIINDKYLCKYPSFRAFKYPIQSESTEQETSDFDENTPQDVLERAYQAINASLTEDLLSEILKQTPAFFEQLVVALLKKMGYGGSIEDSGRVTGKSGDGGIDGIIREDKLGFSLIYIQAKRWDPDRTVGRPDMQQFVGALVGQGATKGLFITTSKFSKEAIEFAELQHSAKVVLVDGKLLTQYMIECNLGVSVQNVYEVKRIDTDFFSDEEL